MNNMISNEQFKKYALSFAEVEEAPHFVHKAYKVKKKIFATHNSIERRCCVRLSPEEQSMLCLIDPEMIYPVPNKFGKQGWTLVNLKKVNKEILMGVLTAAYCTVAPPKLAAVYLNNEE